MEAYDTDAYGNTIIFTAPDPSGNWFSSAATQSAFGANEIIFCGYRFDPETILYYVRNRTYGPVLGRWLQRDPIWYADGEGLYSMVGAQPCAYADPSGLAPRGPVLVLRHAPGGQRYYLTRAMRAKIARIEKEWRHRFNETRKAQLKAINACGKRHLVQFVGDKEWEVSAVLGRYYIDPVPKVGVSGRTSHEIVGIDGSGGSGGISLQRYVEAGGTFAYQLTVSARHYLWACQRPWLCNSTRNIGPMHKQLVRNSLRFSLRPVLEHLSYLMVGRSHLRLHLVPTIGIGGGDAGGGE